MSTNKQRRESERQRLQRQLEERRKRDVARRRNTTIASVAGALVVIAGVIVIVAVSASGGGGKPAATKNGSTTPTAAAPTTAANPTVPTPTVGCTKPNGKATATYADLTIKNAVNLKVAPVVAGKSATEPKTVECMDLVSGTGKAASVSSTASVQYVGVTYATGSIFDSTWAKGGTPATFSLKSGVGGVITGFSQGIAGAGKIAPMREGGRRVIIMPSAAGYGQGALVFVVDLKSISA